MLWHSAAARQAGEVNTEGQGQAQPVVNQEFWAAVEPIRVGVTPAGEFSTFLGALGQRHREKPNLQQVGVTPMEFGGSEAAQTRAVLVQFSMSIVQDTSESSSPCQGVLFTAGRFLFPQLRFPQCH